MGATEHTHTRAHTSTHTHIHTHTHTHTTHTPTWGARIVFREESVIEKKNLYVTGLPLLGGRQNRLIMRPLTPRRIVQRPGPVLLTLPQTSSYLRQVRTRDFAVLPSTFAEARLKLCRDPARTQVTQLFSWRNFFVSNHLAPRPGVCFCLGFYTYFVSMMAAAVTLAAEKNSKYRPLPSFPPLTPCWNVLNYSRH